MKIWHERPSNEDDGREANEKKIKMSFTKDVLALINEDAFCFGIKKGSLVESCILYYCKESEILQKSEMDGEESLLGETFFFRRTLAGLITRRKNSDESQRRRFFEKGTKASYIWSPTKKACEKLKEDKLSAGENGSFIRDLLEDYASMPFGQREKIILADRIKEIETAIEEGKAFEYVCKKGYPMVMHPYAIKTDPYLQYTYVIGNAVKASEYDPKSFVPSEKNIWNLRVFNLTKRNGYWIKILDEKAKIDEVSILKKAEEIPYGFFSGEPREIVVELNGAGRRLYKSIIHNRPRIEFEKEIDFNDEGFRTYKFVATIFQAAIYFMNFEDKARIISPPEAVDAIKSRLKKALNMYE